MAKFDWNKFLSGFFGAGAQSVSAYYAQQRADKAKAESEAKGAGIDAAKLKREEDTRGFLKMWLGVDTGEDAALAPTGAVSEEDALRADLEGRITEMEFPGRAGEPDYPQDREFPIGEDGRERTKEGQYIWDYLEGGGDPNTAVYWMNMAGGPGAMFEEDGNGETVNMDEMELVIALMRGDQGSGYTPDLTREFLKDLGMDGDLEVEKFMQNPDMWSLRFPSPEPEDPEMYIPPIGAAEKGQPVYEVKDGKYELVDFLPPWALPEEDKPELRGGPGTGLWVIEDGEIVKEYPAIDQDIPTGLELADRLDDSIYELGKEPYEKVKNDCSSYAGCVLDRTYGLDLGRITTESVLTDNRFSPVSDELQAGDLVIWRGEHKGHMGVIRDDGTVAHMSSAAKGLKIESLAEANAKYEKLYGSPQYRRLDPSAMIKERVDEAKPTIFNVPDWFYEMEKAKLQTAGEYTAQGIAISDPDWIKGSSAKNETEIVRRWTEYQANYESLAQTIASEWVSGNLADDEIFEKYPELLLDTELYDMVIAEIEGPPPPRHRIY